ncbi:MAG TPA: hypothetical protein VK963_03580, partial [Candidatus Saccharimonadales bacterium]|nr:hypothetical protein [Candidatus Saccharimonadales bacterium]
LSPMKFQLRTPTNITYGGGTLTQEALDCIGEALWEKLKELILAGIRFEHIAGIPQAGQPIAQAVAAAAAREGRVLSIIYLFKEGAGNKRRIAGVEQGNWKAGDRVILIDDVVSHGNSGMEAIEAAEGEGILVAELLALIDWELGGVEHLTRQGFSASTVMSVSQVLGILVSAGTLSRRQANRVRRYQRKDRRFSQKTIYPCKT